MAQVIRELTWYEKDGDLLVGESILTGINLITLKQLFGLLPDDPMAYVYPVNESHIDYLQEFTSHKINLNKYDYFLDNYSSSD